MSDDQKKPELTPEQKRVAEDLADLLTQYGVKKGISLLDIGSTEINEFMKSDEVKRALGRK